MWNKSRSYRFTKGDRLGIGTPEASGRGTPLHMSNKKSKWHKGVSLVARDALLNNGLSTPDGMFDAMGPTFSKVEKAETDRFTRMIALPSPSSTPSQNHLLGCFKFLSLRL